MDGSGTEPYTASVAIENDRIAAIGPLENYSAKYVVDGAGKTLAPGFIDAHTHDDLYLIRSPEMLPKISQGISTVIAGNCGISAAPVSLAGPLPDPMNLLGDASEFRYRSFGEYVQAVEDSHPAVNVAALAGHTALRSNHMKVLDRTATAGEIAAMHADLREALGAGALGLSTGLAYASANSASAEEVLALAEALQKTGGIYATHLRSEADQILEAIREALNVGALTKARVVISHLKCAGIANWGRSEEVLQSLSRPCREQTAGWDCYPYAASSSTLDLRQVDERIRITITWSENHPEMAGKSLAEIAESWQSSQMEAARRLQPAGAIYHCMAEGDVQAILKHPGTMIGSDGLPCDPRPHPRLWGTFPRVLGHYCRERKLFSLGEAVRRMTNLPARRFGLKARGMVREGYFADLVLFDAATIADCATYGQPARQASGIEAVWVNGVLSYTTGGCTGNRAGRFLRRQ